MNVSFRQIMDVIEQYDKIIVFRHIHPDYDAIGSQFGLIRWLRSIYPTKEIIGTGYEMSLDNSFIENPTTLEPSSCAGALAIAVDTSTSERIDGYDLWQLCEKRICIDHHIREKVMGDYEYVDTTAGSCSEIIASIIHDINPKSLTKESAEALYAGIIADTLRFSVESVSSNTLKMAGFLLDAGIDINDVNNQVFQNDLVEYKFANELRNIAVYEEDFIYAILKKEDYIKYGIASSKAKSKVSIFGQVKGIVSWVLFAEDENESGTYSASLRSHKLKVNDIAEKYGGGGHKCACGIPKLSIDQCHEIISLLKDRIRN